MRPLFRLAVRRSAERELDEEFAFHLEMRTRELIGQGYAPDAARLEARRQFGDLEAARAYCRSTDLRRGKRAMRTELLHELRQDIGFAVRGLRRSPAYALVAVLTLALGIGATTAIFSVVRGVLLRPLPFPDPARVIMVASTYQDQYSPSSPANIADWQAQNRSFGALAAIENHSAVLTGAGEPERLKGYNVGGDFFAILGVDPVAGRLRFTPDETAWPGAKVVVLSQTLWRTRFGSDAGLVNRVITLDNQRYRVIGIAPAESVWPSGAQLWFPFSFDPKELAGSRGAVYLNLIGRLKPGVTLDAAQSDLAAITRRLAKDYPDMNTGLGVRLYPLLEWITGELTRPLYILLGGVGFVLLIACANVANLALVRGVAREGELAVRTALGAGRGRLVRQLVTESVVLGLLGAAAGLALAAVGTRLLVQAAPVSIPRLGSIRVDGLVLGFTLAIGLATALLFGVLPARLVVRPDLARTLRETGRSGAGHPGGNRLRRLLVIAEVALSVMLLAGAGLLIRSFTRLTRVDPGFRTEGSVSFALSLPEASYPKGERQAVFMRSLLERMRAVAGVQSAGAAFGMPLTSFSFNFNFEIAGRPALTPAEQPAAEVRVATPGYFTTMGIPLLRGRGFSESDRAGGPRVLLITASGAQRFFPSDDPIGKHVSFGWGRGDNHLEGDIVGVVGDVKLTSLAAATVPQFWAPFDQWTVSSFNVILHGSRDPDALVQDARRAVHELDPGLALAQVRTLDALFADSVAQPRFYMLLLSAFAGVALLLSAVGIYGVIAYLAGRRVREIGIRLALGASRARVVAMIVGEGGAMVLAGLGIGVAAALGLSRVLGALLFGVTPRDPLTFVLVAGALALVALVASGLPALKAARVDPALTMRAE